MNLNLSKLFPRGVKPPVKIIAKRNMLLALDGKQQHVAAGTEVEIPYDEFRQLEPADFALVSLNQTKLEIEDPTPAAPTPEAAPAAWASLPACFHEYHRTEAEITAARRHIRLIQDKRKEIFGTSTDLSKAEGVMLSGGILTSSDRNNGNVLSTLRELNMDDPVNRKTARFLTIAEESAKDHLNRLLETSDIPQQRRFLECGTHRIDAAEELQLLVQDLADTGFQIFCCRIAALGLAETHCRRLFCASADALKYASQPPAYVGGVCFAGMADDGRMRRYSDLPVASSAGHLLRDRERIKELQPQLKTAKAELARAQKASQAVAA